MYHLVARTRPGAPMFSSWEEARSLWVRIVAACPGLHALCLMPDHLHLLHPDDMRLVVARVVSGYARWRNRRSGRSGGLFLPLPPAVEVPGVQKQRRSIRYVHLNPCRARLVSDPLAWPFSTHLEALGLVVEPARPRHPDPLGFHRYVSADPTVCVQGTDPPVAGIAPFELERVVAAVSVATRMPIPRLYQRRGSGRTLLVRAARSLTDASVAEIASTLGLSRSAVHRVEVHPDASLSRLAALAADHRIAPMREGDLWTGGRFRAG